MGVNGNTLQVREGNKNDMLTDRYIQKGNTLIMGYGRPAWEAPFRYHHSKADL